MTAIPPETVRELAYLRSRITYAERVIKAAAPFTFIGASHRPSPTTDQVQELVYARNAYGDFLGLRPDPGQKPSAEATRMLRALDASTRRERMAAAGPVAS